jgi:hypothetical protein
MKVSNHNMPKLQSIITAGLLSLSFTFSSTLFAESVALPTAEQINQSAQIPQNGQKQENVETQFGAPIERVAAVGEPPISKWVYQDFTVYFENNIVLHAVLHRT